MQNVNIAATPLQPDETQDQTVAIANGDAGFATGLWYQTAALSATRSVAFGELLAVVVEFDGSGRLGVDAVNFDNLTATNATAQLASGVSVKTASWTALSVWPNIILEFDDGTFGTFSEGFPYSGIPSETFGSTTNPDERALEFTVPFPCKVDGAWMLMRAVATGSDFEIVLYEGSTALATVSYTGFAVTTNSGTRIIYPAFAEQTLVPGTTYRLALKPLTTNTVNFLTHEIANANHRQALPGGTAWAYTTRNDAGAWAAPTTTKRLFAGIRISALDDGAGGGGSPIARPGLHSIGQGISA